MSGPLGIEELHEAAGEFAAVADELLAARLKLVAEEPVERLVGRHQAIWPELVELGWPELLIPAERDGLGFGPAVLGECFRVFGRHLAPGPLAANLFVAPWLAARGDCAALEAARAEGALFALADGVAAGWSQRDRQVRHADGRLDGTVLSVPGADVAERLLVVAVGEAGGCVAVVPTERDGVTIRQREAMDPCEGIGTVELAGCRIEPDEVVATGDEALMEMRAWLRVLASCELLGVVERVLEMSVEYAKQRKQFDRPIGANQAVKHMLADIACDAVALANLATLTVREAEAEPAGAVRRAAMVLKSFASEVGIRSCERGLQAHGGIGFTAEYQLHWYFKRALTLCGRYGTPAELNLALGRSALGDAEALAA